MVSIGDLKVQLFADGAERRRYEIDLFRPAIQETTTMLVGR